MMNRAYFDLLWHGLLGDTDFVGFGVYFIIFSLHFIDYDKIYNLVLMLSYNHFAIFMILIHLLEVIKFWSIKF